MIVLNLCTPEPNNSTGDLIYQKENINTSILQIEFNVSPGVYIIEVRLQGEKQQFKLVKK